MTLNEINAERIASNMKPLDRLPREIDNDRRRSTYWSTGGQGSAAGNWTHAPRTGTHLQTEAEAKEIRKER